VKKDPPTLKFIIIEGLHQLPPLDCRLQWSDGSQERVVQCRNETFAAFFDASVIYPIDRGEPPIVMEFSL